MNKNQTTIANVYPVGLLREMYNHYLELYQSRFTVRTPAHTWGHIMYWKKWMHFYADALIEKGKLTRAEFSAARAIIIDEQDGIKIDIELRKKQIPD